MSEATDALMLRFGWAVHDFQRMARSLMLLVASFAPDDFPEQDFDAGVDLLTGGNGGLGSAGRRLAEVLSDDDRRLLRSLKTLRGRLFYEFFVGRRVEGASAEVVAALDTDLTAVGKTLVDADALLNRLYAELED